MCIQNSNSMQFNSWSFHCFQQRSFIDGLYGIVVVNDGIVWFLNFETRSTSHCSMLKTCTSKAGDIEFPLQSWYASYSMVSVWVWQHTRATIPSQERSGRDALWQCGRDIWGLSHPKASFPSCAFWQLLHWQQTTWQDLSRVFTVFPYHSYFVCSPPCAKWDQSGQFIRKVGKSALELGKKKKINHQNRLLTVPMCQVLPTKSSKMFKARSLQSWWGQWEESGRSLDVIDSLEEQLR